MTKENAIKANEIIKLIERLKDDLKRANYTQSEGVVIRTSYLNFNGIDDRIEVPSSLFKVIGKLIVCELKDKINGLEKELDLL